EILRYLVSLPTGPVAQAEVAAALGCGTSPFKPLLEAGLLEAVMVPIRRNPWPDAAQIPLGLSLTTDQAGALQEIVEVIRRSSSTCTTMGITSIPPLANGGSGRVGSSAGPEDASTGSALMAAPRPEVVLLRGVTGSGKTEVYLRAIEETRQRGRQSIALVPEISLTAQMIGIFHSRFGDRVAVLHSKLSDGERLDEWQRIRRGEVDVVIGARSGLFAPLPRLGLIVLDEEHESSYKQQGDPCYLARDTAMERARLTGACVILGSATPSLESARMAATGAARLILLPTRIDDRPLPPVTLVDQRRELKENPGRIFSRRLQAAIEQRLQDGDQTILFLNRRGFATITLCRDCGYVAHCKNCAVSLTFYVSSRLLRCHHCEYTIPAPDVCPGCSGLNIRQFGIGTEKVEAELATLFPDARIARMDTDSLSRKGSAQDLVARFRAGRIDILVGTQMVAKGFDFPGVTLVGVVSADTMLNLPDFRAAERTFQILTQVSGRAGRGDRPGEVIVQTFSPENYAIQAAARHDFDEFYRQEIPIRREARYPPFVRLANLVVEGFTRAEARGRAEVVGGRLIEAIGADPVELLGPTPAPLTRIKSRFRWHLLLKSEDGLLIRNACRTMRSHLKSDELQHLTIDLDPMSLL
nr:primosomal protein N' [Armatimonadota bacterium]